MHGLPDEQTPLDELELETVLEVVAAGAAVVVSAGGVYTTAAAVVVGVSTGAMDTGIEFEVSTTGGTYTDEVVLVVGAT